MKQWIYYKEENICEGIIEYEQDILIEVTIPKGKHQLKHMLILVLDNVH